MILICEDEKLQMRTMFVSFQHPLFTPLGLSVSLPFLKCVTFIVLHTQTRMCAHVCACAHTHAYLVFLICTHL